MCVHIRTGMDVEFLPGLDYSPPYLPYDSMAHQLN